MLSWQNIWNSRHFAADIEKKLTNQREVFRPGISCTNLSLSEKTVSHVISEWHWKSTFDFNCKQLLVEARNSMSNYETYFPLFSETVHTVLKIFSQYGLWQLRRDYY